MEPSRRSYFTRRGIAVCQPASHRPGESDRGGDHGRDREVDVSDVDINGYREIDLFAGAMHYWRLSRNDWPACLAAMKSLGLRVVDTYVPWSVHEVAPGRHDWRGQRDLSAFIDEVERAGMYAIVRPGPHINAELTFFGFPERILKTADYLAVSGRDTPVWLPAPTRMFPVPSYAARGFAGEVAAWYAAMADIVAPRMAPHGPVIAVQVDNEAQMFFRLGAYDHDYHPDALAWWHEYSHGAEPPRAWDADDPARCIMWVRFKQEYMARSLAWMSNALDEAGMGTIARFHNLPPAEPALVNVPRTSQATGGMAGMDFYHTKSAYQASRRRALYLVGSADPLPFAAEVGVGGPLWLPPMSVDDQQNIILVLLAAGVRAFNLYMIVDRERWYGAAISERGQKRAHAAWIARLLAVLADIEWTALRRRVPVALVLCRADACFALATSVADPLSPVLTQLLDLGPGGMAELALDPGATEHGRWFHATERALDLAQVPYEIVDEDCPVEHLARYQAVIAPTMDRVDSALWDKLHALARQKRVVVLGPKRPTRDEYDRPLGKRASLPARAGLIRAESLHDLDGFADDLAALAALDDDLPGGWLAEQPGVDCALFEDPHKRPRVLFVANRTGHGASADIATPGPARLVDPFTSRRFAARDEHVTIELAPYQVRMLLVE